MHYNPYRPDINTLGIFVPCCYLWGHINECSGLLFGIGLEKQLPFTEAEVYNLYRLKVIWIIQENVRRLQISMDYALIVDVSNCSTNDLHNFSTLEICYPTSICKFVDY